MVTVIVRALVLFTRRPLALHSDKGVQGPTLHLGAARCVSTVVSKHCPS